jgi:hypothetical protein
MDSLIKITVLYMNPLIFKIKYQGHRVILVATGSCFAVHIVTFFTNNMHLSQCTCKIPADMGGKYVKMGDSKKGFKHTIFC